MSDAKAHAEWVSWIYGRAQRQGNKVPGTGILFLEELSGPDGAHFTLFVTNENANQIDHAKTICRNRWDVTGFTIIRIKQEPQPQNQ